MSSPPDHTFIRPRLTGLALSQAVEGFGFRFVTVILGLYAALTGGVPGFAVFAAAGLLGMVLAVPADLWLSHVSGLKFRLVVAAVLMTVLRLAQLVVLATGSSLLLLGGLELAASCSGVLMIGASKSLAAGRGKAPHSSLAWMQIASSSGKALGIAAGALLTASSLSPHALAALAGAVSLAQILPLVRVTLKAPDATGRATRAPLLPLVRSCGPLIAFAGVVSGAAFALPQLHEGLGADWFGPETVAVAAFAILAGNWLAVIPSRSAGTGANLYVALPVMGLLATLLWIPAASGVGWFMLASVGVGVLLVRFNAALEGRLSELVPGELRSAALTAALGGWALGTAVGVAGGAALIEWLGPPVSALALAGICVLLLLWSLLATARRTRQGSSVEQR